MLCTERGRLPAAYQLKLHDVERTLVPAHRLFESLDRLLKQAEPQPAQQAQQQQAQQQQGGGAAGAEEAQEHDGLELEMEQEEEGSEGEGGSDAGAHLGCTLRPLLQGMSWLAPLSVLGAC